MPVKEKKVVNGFYIQTESGMVKLGNAVEEMQQRYIGEAEIKEAFNIPQDFVLNHVDNDTFLMVFGVATHKQLNTNNWRKNHGMVMKRGRRR